MSKSSVPGRRSSGLGRIARAAALLVREPELRMVVLASFVLGMAVSFVLPFLSLFGTSEVGMTLAGFGAFMTVTTLCNISISTWLSHHSDKLQSRRVLMLTSSACGALGYAGYAVAREVWLLLLIGSLLLGVASLTFSQLFAHARELIDRSGIESTDAPLYLNTFRMCFALAWTVGPALAASLLAHMSFRGLFLSAASLYLVFFVLVFGWVRPRPLAPMQPAARVGIAELLVRPGVWPWFVALALVYAAHTMSMNNMSLLVLHVLGGNERHVGVIFSLAPVFELPFMLYFGLLATRIDVSRLIRFAMGLAIVYYAALANVRAPWQIYPLQFLSAAIVSVTSGVAITFFQNKLPGQLGAATNLYSNASRVGSTSGYLIFGVVASHLGHRGAYAACAGLATLALALASVLDRPPVVAVVDG